MYQAERFSFDKQTQDLLEHLTVPFAIYQYIDKRVVTIVLSQGFCDEFGFENLDAAYRVMNHDMYRATHPDDKTRIAEAAYRFAAFDEPFDVVYRTRTYKDPDYILIHTRGKSFYPEPGVRLCLTWYAHEGMYSPEEATGNHVPNPILERILADKEQYRGMYYDYLTGLPNISYFYELAEAGRKRMRQQNVDSAILFFDLTGLKYFNERHGFTEGDNLLRSVAAILAKHFSNESCARFAQDHFAVFAPEDGLDEQLDAVISECSRANNGKTLPLRIGIYPDRIGTVEIGTACDRARLAADARKQYRESYYMYFDIDMLTEEKNRQSIVDNLDKALEENWIKVYYQPIIRATSGRVCCVEALTRWDDPERGELKPSSFVPILEESMQIHKLDLFALKQVLRDLNDNEKKGVPNVPVSINFSRADFDACDLVHEICAMVDAAQIDRHMIIIEITESMVGRDFDYMREQINHFHHHGFQIWMDDFGSGYSSLDVLQNVKFDLIKYDLRFLKQLDEGVGGRIILTEMMRMANSLGLDTICEGVETQEQIRFLQEIGCSKLQGYYFSEPMPRETLLKMFRNQTLIEGENPKETDYYESIGRVNLFDFGALASEEKATLQNTFDTIPIAILELKDGKARFVRFNHSYLDFANRFFVTDNLQEQLDFDNGSNEYGSAFFSILKQCCSSGNHIFFDEKMVDGSVVHSFARRIDTNPVTGSVAVAVAVLSISEADESTTYAEIARSLTADYYHIYVVNLDNDDYVEYSSQVGGEELLIERHGEQFFDSVRLDMRGRIYEEDKASFLKLFTKENVLRDLDERGVFTTTFRLDKGGSPMHVNLKITRMRGGNRIIMGISVIDAHVKQIGKL